MDETPVAVEIQNLTKIYPDSPAPKIALNDVSLHAPLGQIVCLLGPNGSGKTTLLKILAGLLSPTSGTVRLMGSDIAEYPHLARKKVGWLPADERSGFYGRLTGKENLNFFGALHGQRTAKMGRTVGNLSILLGIGGELNQQILRLSGGERQKISLARALLHDPPVLLLDEPFRNLDPHTVVRFRRLLKDHLAKVQKKSILLSTHQLDEAKRLADVIVILHKGRVLRTFTHRELLHETKSGSVEEMYLKLIDRSDENE